VNTSDISNLNYAELNQLRAAVAERMKEMRDTGITQLRATIAEQAQLLGVELKDLVPRKTRRRRKSDDGA
jgi:hypothetical protein